MPIRHSVDDKTLQAMYGPMKEAQLQELVRRAAITAGWLYYHTHDSRRSDPGFPDVVMVRSGRALFRELKTQTGKLSAAQEEWGRKLIESGCDFAVWRPVDWGRGDILREIE